MEANMTEITRKSFGITKDNEEISLFTMKNDKLTATVTDFGAILVNLLVPDKTGALRDVVLGYDNAEGYFVNHGSLGSSVGPVANRTAGGSFTLDGVTYQMPQNEGENNLHSDKKFNKRMWKAAQHETGVEFSLHLPNGEGGLPGNRDISITYSLTESGLQIRYHAESDKKTVFNPTNHSYFNLAGEAAGHIEEQIVQMNCAAFTPTGENLIPTGEICPVEGTPMDFREEKVIGADIDADYPALKYGKGYDNNYVIDGWSDDGELRLAARAYDPEGGCVMETYTTLPGVQFYTANTLNIAVGKEGKPYGNRAGYCFETQYFPDSIHHENFPCNVFGEGRNYDSVTEYRFSVQA